MYSNFKVRLSYSRNFVSLIGQEKVRLLRSQSSDYASCAGHHHDDP